MRLIAPTEPRSTEHQRPLAPPGPPRPAGRPPGAARHRRRRHDRQSRGPGVFPDGTGKRRLATDRPNRGRNIVVRRSHRLPAAGRLGQRRGRHRQPPPRLHAPNHSPAPHVPRRFRCLPCCRCGWLRAASHALSLAVPRRGEAEPRQEEGEGPDGRTDACRIPRPPFCHG
ncbi:hypothetical protein PAHAL_5G145400 [Panicum hallii]|uniref:Uncharacterized protein n=1 Tax=Panicum hallii TaxID=206008 RepID=A0A2T8IJZ9_9POAL|nr:hypothetical protein PAHAL_5G145400 [Panicum hallii]